MYFNLVATNAEVETMELQVLVAHGSNRSFALEEPLELGRLYVVINVHRVHYKSTH